MSVFGVFVFFSVCLSVSLSATPSMLSQAVAMGVRSSPRNTTGSDGDCLALGPEFIFKVYHSMFPISPHCPKLQFTEDTRGTGPPMVLPELQKLCVMWPKHRQLLRRRLEGQCGKMGVLLQVRGDSFVSKTPAGFPSLSG